MPALDLSMTAASTAGSAIRTFLIADVRGYTAFTQQHGDEAAGRLAARFAEIAQEGVEACGGELVELRGDEALAVFTSARDALRAATELAEAFSEATEDDPALPLGVGFGLDAGEAVPVAGGYRGGALNLAARLCGRAGAGEVLASEGVIHLARTIDGLSFEPTEPFELKGISEPVRAARVTATHAATIIAPRTADRRRETELPPELDLVSPFVGRKNELRWLRWAWRRTRHGHGRAVFLVGAPGMGRTRLAAELAREAGWDGAIVTYVGCSEPTGVTLSILQRAASIEGSAVVIVDDLSEEIEGIREALQHLIDQTRGRDLLMVATCEEPLARWVSDLLQQVDPTWQRTSSPGAAQCTGSGRARDHVRRHDPRRSATQRPDGRHGRLTRAAPRVRDRLGRRTRCQSVERVRRYGARATLGPAHRRGGARRDRRGHRARSRTRQDPRSGVREAGRGHPSSHLGLSVQGARDVRRRGRGVLLRTGAARRRDGCTVGWRDLPGRRRTLGQRQVFGGPSRSDAGPRVGSASRKRGLAPGVDPAWGASGGRARASSVRRRPPHPGRGPVRRAVHHVRR
ncbi:MAG: hypothetical protein E6G58_01815 [Actinobacteria bacterium]|nr:MAG: hypothetical protein E6G58_01815 [Actinomycetota bacterium]